MALTQQVSDQECIGDSLDTFNANFSALDTAVVAVSSQLTSGVVDGDKGSITVTGGGTVWTIDSNAVSTPMLSAECVTADKVAKGAVVQVALSANAAHVYTAATIPYTDTVPLSSDGLEILSMGFTPTAVGNKVLVQLVVPYVTASATHVVTFAIFRGGICIGAGVVLPFNAGYLHSMSASVMDSPNSVSEQTYSVRMGGSGGTVYINGYSTRIHGGALATTLTLTEIKA